MSFWNRSNFISKSLQLYDVFVNEINCKYIWSCDKSKIFNLYQKNVRPNHVEIGPGTGYYLKPSMHKIKNLSLVDINQDILDYSQKKLKEDNCNIETFRINLFSNPTKFTITENSSIGVNCVLHCIPGKLQDKIQCILDNIENDKNVILFGTTVVHDKSDSVLVNLELKFLNYFKIFQNCNDFSHELVEYLHKKKYTYRIEKFGQILFFTIQKD